MTVANLYTSFQCAKLYIQLLIIPSKGILELGNLWMIVSIGFVP